MQQKRYISFILFIIFLFNVNVSNIALAQALPGGPAGGDTLGRDMALMAIYGTMSGVIIGAASLAFVSRPLTKLRSIAVGASLGLYVGILLGGLVALDRSVGTGGGSIFDIPADRIEEVPIVLYKDKKFNFSFPTLLAYEKSYKRKTDLNTYDKSSIVSASFFTLKF